MKNLLILIFVLCLSVSVKAYDTYTIFVDSQVDTFVFFNYADFTEFTESSVDTFVIYDTSIIAIIPVEKKYYINLYIKQRKRRRLR